MDHKEMRHNVAELSEHKLLKTIEYVTDHADTELTCSELEKIDLCWHAIKNIHAAMTYATSNSTK